MQSVCCLVFASCPIETIARGRVLRMQVVSFFLKKDSERKKFHRSRAAFFSFSSRFVCTPAARQQLLKSFQCTSSVALLHNQVFFFHLHPSARSSDKHVHTFLCAGEVMSCYSSVESRGWLHAPQPHWRTPPRSDTGSLQGGGAKETKGQNQHVSGCFIRAARLISLFHAAVTLINHRSASGCVGPF